MLWSLEGPAVENRVLAIDGDDAYPAELYFLVACAKEPAVLDQVLPSLSLVTDRHHSVYAEWSRTYAENRQLGARVAELEQRLAAVPAPRELSAAEHLKGFLRRLLRG